MTTNGTLIKDEAAVTGMS